MKMAVKNLCGTTLLVILLCFKIGTSDIIIAPSSREAQMDSSTYFNCTTSVTSKEVQWFHYSVSSSERRFVYAFGQIYSPYLGRFEVEKNVTAGEYNLLISSMQAVDAGKYECQDEAGAGMKKSAQLIIIDGDPTCQSNVNVEKVIGPNSCGIEPDELILTCAVQYHGNEAPILQWGLNDDNETLTEGVTRETTGNRVLYNLTMTTEQISIDSLYVCRTTRSTSKISCNSGKVKVVGAASLATTSCPSTKPCVAAIVVTWFLLIPVIILASAVLGIFCLIRRPLKILDQPLNKLSRRVARKNKERLPEAENLTSEEIVPVDVSIEPEEPEPENNGKTRDEKSEQYEQLMKENRQLKKRVKQKDTEVVDLQNKNKELQIDKSELEGRLYPSETNCYAVPKLVTEIVIKDLKMDSKKETRPIFGMTILRGKLYVVTEESSEIIVYDSVTFNAEANWSISEMSKPLDIASCNTNNCLYTVSYSADRMFVFRVDSGKSILKKWPIAEDECHLSVGRNSNVIVSFFNGNRIIEYSPDGAELMPVRLSPADNISHPWHAIKTTGMHFIVSHGRGDDSLQRVCILEADGKIKKSVGGKKGSDKELMNCPSCIIEDGFYNVLVADMKNKRVLLMSPTLEFKGILVSKDNSKLRFPMRICLDEERGILFVADNNYKEKVHKFDSGRILIFNYKK